VAVDAVLDARTEERRAQLRRMRQLATGMLFLMLAVFLASTMLVASRPWLAYVRAFAEAAMVGACADWFAVVALFRHPLGIPIPHTAIVPTHKQRIGEYLGHFIAQDFLKPAEVTSRLQQVDVAGWIARWLTIPENARSLAVSLQGLLPPLLDVLGDDRLRAFSRTAIRTGIDSIETGPLAARVLNVLMAHGQEQIVFELGIDAGTAFLEEHREGIRKRISRNRGRWLRNWVDGKVADAVVDEMLSALADARATAHPWRAEYRAWLKRQTARLADDPEVVEACERIKSEVLDSSVVDGYLDWVGAELQSKVRSDWAAQEGTTVLALERVLVAAGGWLEADARVRERVNAWTQQLLVYAVVPNRDDIGAFIAGVVERWDTETLVSKLELQVGRDLQFIRINGTLVGGAVGLLIFSLERLF
jgi:uncharacterized membrane-anchored protein YjiN (DUF445 family)